MTLDRADRRNAWTRDLEQDYRSAMLTVEQSADVRVVVVTGAGPAFCAGGDLDGLRAMADARAFDESLFDAGAYASSPPRDFDGPFTFQLNMSKPVIAAINGAAAGGGLILASYCDIRFASESATFTTAFGRLGLPAEFALSWILCRLVGVGNAADLLLSSRRVNADEAQRMGLVSRTFPAAELLPAVLAYARSMAAQLSPASLRVIKQQIWRDSNSDLSPALQRSSSLTRAMITEPDFVEGVEALLNRRPPQFLPTSPQP